MNMKIGKKILVLLICMLPFFAMSQGNAKKRERKLEQQNAKKDAEALRSYQKAIKSHQKNQDKPTRKRMKQSVKEMKRGPGSTKKTFFLKRWFSKDK